MPIPAPPSDLRGFPEVVLGPPVTLWRVHSHPEPWHFASGGDGRFDLASPRGTCYASDDRLGAFVEHLGPLVAPGRAVSLQILRSRFLSSLTVEGRLRLADLTAREALGRFGVTAEVGAAVDYAQTREWAEALAEAGFAGMRYAARHDPSGKLRSVALFGKPGARPPGKASTEPLPPAFIVEAAVAFGITVAPEILP